ncbi:MAG TPA: ATP-binding protein [Flavobacterium sp.]|jgi:signal transduction histidine kinase
MMDKHGHISIRNKLMRVIMLVSGIVVLLTCAAFFLYEYYAFRERTLQKLATYGEIFAANSTAALAFQDKDEAFEILSALKAEPNIVSAVIYDADGKVFSVYPENATGFPIQPGKAGYGFTKTSLEGYEPIVQGSTRLGTLYLQSDLQAMYSRFGLYGFIVLLILTLAFLLSFLLSRFLQRGISQPILALADTAKIVSEHQDYSVRAKKSEDDEVGSLTDAFNQMLERIETQTASLNEFNQTLEDMVDERTSELETANRELEAFSYTVSHDLRAPLRAIDSYTQIFIEDYADRLDGEGRRLINIVLNNGKKMGVLIDDLLAFSQLGRKELTKSILPMHEIVQQAWDELYADETNREIQLVLHKLPNAYAERPTIQQVWINLISNALKYTKNEGIAIIEISGERKGDEVLYSIADNGSGFDMQYYNKLFGVFQRLHSREEFEGTGVGLAIVERIIEKHGGRIWAVGKVDQGATFTFTLPATPHD